MLIARVNSLRNLTCARKSEKLKSEIRFLIITFRSSLLIEIRRIHQYSGSSKSVMVRL